MSRLVNNNGYHELSIDEDVRVLTKEQGEKITEYLNSDVQKHLKQVQKKEK